MTEVLLTGLVIGESARWHDGRLWLSNWGAQEVLAVDLDGRREVMARVPTTLPFSIDWLPDGRLLVTSGPEGLLLRQEPSGDLVVHATVQTPTRLTEEQQDLLRQFAALRGEERPEGRLTPANKGLFGKLRDAFKEK